ncbi:protein-L-isoaspartate O-methyltransferase [Trichocladium antarcticum]|uniref:protein-L-isoaspartate(D-aspartate) O-methyltransferase n=1 Tax=Trichocladium antarcticum TaxID=1450529 RepID=A0AAN6UQI2_9PEZI|nr:protein-L-isoaspartate O-methyltransferase [Trichocladium antarcticum]
MAWRSSGGSNRDLIENLFRNGMIKHLEVKEAFLKVDRAHYAPSHPYDDSPQPIGHHATISAPHMHASAVENLLPFLTPSPARPAPRALDIGSGSGYLTHVMAELVGGGGGAVVGVEHIAPLRDMGERNMRKSEDGRRLLDAGRVRFVVGDGRRGWVDTEGGGLKGEGGKWDAIHVGAAAAEVHPELLAQLASPGRMFIPVDDELGGGDQHVWCVDKDGEGVVTKRRLFGVRYVPLTDPPSE